MNYKSLYICLVLLAFGINLSCQNLTNGIFKFKAVYPDYVCDIDMYVSDNVLFFNHSTCDSLARIRYGERTDSDELPRPFRIIDLTNKTEYKCTQNGECVSKPYENLFDVFKSDAISDTAHLISKTSMNQSGLNQFDDDEMVFVGKIKYEFIKEPGVKMEHSTVVNEWFISTEIGGISKKCYYTNYQYDVPGIISGGSLGVNGKLKSWFEFTSFTPKKIDDDELMAYIKERE